MPRVRTRWPSVTLLLILSLAPRAIEGKGSRGGRAGGGGSRDARHRGKLVAASTYDAVTQRMPELGTFFDPTSSAAGLGPEGVVGVGEGELNDMRSAATRTEQPRHTVAEANAVSPAPATPAAGAVATAKKAAFASIATAESTPLDVDAAKLAHACDGYICVSNGKCIRDWAECSNAWMRLAVLNGTSGVNGPAGVQVVSSPFNPALGVFFVSFVMASIGLVLLRFGSGVRAERLLWMFGCMVLGGSSRGRHAPLNYWSNTGGNTSKKHSRSLSAATASDEQVYEQ